MKKNGLIKSTGIVTLNTFLSRILGLVRDLLIANFFKINHNVDGFFIAFRIPNLFRRLVAEGSLTISFIPVYTEYLEKKTAEEALELAQKTFSLLLVVLTAVVSVGIVFSPQIVRLFAWGIEDNKVLLLITGMNRYLFLYLFQVGVVAFAMGYLNSHRHFFAPAFSPVLLNVGFITGALWFRKYFAEELWGLVAGVLLGGLLQMLLQIPFMFREKFRFRFSIDLKHPGIRKIFKMIVPALFGIAVYQINILISTIYATTCEEGSVSYLYYCDRLTELVLGVFIISIGNVILPEMSRCSAHDNVERLKVLFSKSVTASLILAIPAAFILYSIGYPILSLLFMRGNFSHDDAMKTYGALKYAAFIIPSLAVLRITTPTFYSLKDTLTPVLTSCVALISHSILGYFLKNTEMSFSGLSLSNSIAAFLQTVILVFLLRKKIGRINLKYLTVSIFKIVTASCIMTAVVLKIAGLINWDTASLYSKMLYMSYIVISGGAAYFAVCFILRMEEIVGIKNALMKKLH
ncbi:MAG: murein biosynthesis integral membrane protein MurJ [Spirochaetes bacterium]|nr:murein biosynthesis integral membrane protein MurJ [Spirochaetota bacterium]